MLIAEIGNCHFGDFSRAMEMIKIAHDCGADLIKGQAFKAKDIKSGSMPKEFYEKCQFTTIQYLALIDYARSIGNDLFYSIFSNGLEEVRHEQNWHKVTAAQTKEGKAKLVEDAPNVIVSVRDSAVPKLKKASVMYASDYCVTSPTLQYITILSDYLGRPAGYSDHSIGIHHAIRARRFFGATVIEKHFCLAKNEAWKGTVFRDTVHGATPKELERLAKELSK